MTTTPAPSDLEQRIRSLISDATAGRTVRVSVEIRGSRGVALSIEADRAHYAASTMKLPVLLAAYRQRDAGHLDLKADVAVHNDFPSNAGGRFGLDASEDSDPEVWARMGSGASLEWLCRRMIIRSSNLATDLVLEQVGFAPVAEAIAAAGAPGLVVARMIEDYAAQDDGRSNLVTAEGLNTMLMALQAGTPAAPETCAEVLDVLAANEVDTDIRPGLPAGTWVAHKNGWVSDGVHDAALVRPEDAEPFTLSVLTSGDWWRESGEPSSVEREPDDEAVQAGNDRAHDLIRRIATVVWEVRDRL